MKTFRCANDLREYGFKCLTGEACGLNMRCLTDLNEQAAEIWEAFTRTKPVRDGWNDGKYSIMLPYSLMRDLYVFCAVYANKAVAVFAGGYIGKDNWQTLTFHDGESIEAPTDDWVRKNQDVWICEDQKDMDRINELVKSRVFYINRHYKRSNHPGNGIDNQHAMSGRTT